MRRTLTREVYERVLTWFAARYPAPPAYTQCARECGISVDLARRLYLGPAYEEPALHEFQIPMSEVLEKEAAKATALRARQEAEERRRQAEEERRQDLAEAADSRAERVKQRAEEQRMLQAARNLTTGGLGLFLQDLFPAMRDLSVKVRNHASALPAAEAIGMYREVGAIARDLVKAATMIEEAGRRSRGEPSQVVEVQPRLPEPQAYGDALAEVRRAARLLELAEGTPDLVVETTAEEPKQPA